MKCGWRLSEAVQVTHKLPSSAGYFAGPCRRRYAVSREATATLVDFSLCNLVGASARRLRTPTKLTT